MTKTTGSDNLLAELVRCGIEGMRVAIGLADPAGRSRRSSAAGREIAGRHHGQRQAGCLDATLLHVRESLKHERHAVKAREVAWEVDVNACAIRCLRGRRSEHGGDGERSTSPSVTAVISSLT